MSFRSVLCHIETVLLIDNDDALPVLPAREEEEFTGQLSTTELAAIDQRLFAEADSHWLKCARIIANAISAAGYDVSQGGVVELHTRRLIQLIEAGELELQGNPLRPRFSEVRLPSHD